MARRCLVDKIHIMKSDERGRRQSNNYERRDYSSQRFLEDARLLEEGGWFGKAAALYRAGGDEKKARQLYHKVGNQRFKEESTG